MDGERWSRIQGVFHEAVELPASEQRAFVARACEGDSALAAEVRAMLAQDAGGASLLDRGIAEAARHIVGENGRSPLAGQQLGPYRIRELIGEGGMGVVYLAERADLGSLAAIKVLRDAWLSPARRERFRSEQRTLAQLNHTAIARLYDADALPDGTPFFVMEYVEGEPLTQYCRRQGCSIHQRLRLFRAVCEAVQYAHGLAIIHRDLKPSNILVTAEGVVKLLDFGIAKHLQSPEHLADQTRTGLRLMTPAYAAPEQIRGERVGLYTDVYALGVVLYELLAGRLPFDVAGKTAGAIERAIAETEPPKPSSIGERAAAGKATWADLDVLCLKAMHKEAPRRYRSVEALIRDIDHFLAGEPLEARPDSVRYRLGKFVRRHRRAVAAGAAMLATVAGLVAFFTIRLAAARNSALAQAERARRIQHFMLNLFDGGDPTAGPSDNLRAVTLVDRGVQDARALDGEPDVQAELYQTLGNIYQKLGKLERADALLSLALERRRAIFGREHRDVAESLAALANLRVDQGRMEDAARLAAEGLAMSRRTLPHSDPALARAEATLGRVQEHRGDYKQAIATLEHSVRLQSGGKAPAADLAASLSELANCRFYSGDYAESQSLNLRVLGIHEQIYGKRHPLVADDLINLASIQTNLGHYPAAEAYERRALDINRSWYGEDHPETGASLNYLGQALVMQGRYDEAEDMLRRSLAIQERVYGAVHQRVAVALNELGLLAVRRGHFAEAEARFRRAMEIDRAVYGDRHQSVALESANLASVYLQKKEYVRAERLFRDAIERYKETLPANHLNIGIAEIKLGRTLLRERRYQESEVHLLAGEAIMRKQSSPPANWLETVQKDLLELRTEQERSANGRTS